MDLDRAGRRKVIVDIENLREILAPIQIVIESFQVNGG